MAELKYNYNIQCMRLLHELKVAFPSVPDDVVKHYMKKNNNNKVLCSQDLAVECESYLHGRYKTRHRTRLPQRRFSVDTLSSSTLPRHSRSDIPAPLNIQMGGQGKSSPPWRTPKKSRRNSCCHPEDITWYQVLTEVDQNRRGERREDNSNNQNSKRERDCCTSTPSRKISRSSGECGEDNNNNSLDLETSCLFWPQEDQNNSSLGNISRQDACPDRTRGYRRMDKENNTMEEEEDAVHQENATDILKTERDVRRVDRVEEQEEEVEEMAVDPSEMPTEVAVEKSTGSGNGMKAGNVKKKAALPRPLSLSQFSDLEIIPTVVLTPDSPPQDSSDTMRLVQTLYSPDDTTKACTSLEEEILSEESAPGALAQPFSSGMEQSSGVQDLHTDHEIQQQLNIPVPKTLILQESHLSPGVSPEILAEDDQSIIVCGNNCTVTKTCLDILPSVGKLSLPFGKHSNPELDFRPPTVTQTTTSVTQGTLHFVKDAGNGTISLATTTFCGIERTVVSSTIMGNSGSGGCARSTTVIYTLNSRPQVCENPFRKVFTRRKQFYQAKEKEREQGSPETSSKRLLWRPCNHACPRHSLCPDNIQPPHSTLPGSSKSPPPPTPRYFTLNANIQPFEAFSIRHDLSGASMNSSECSSVNLTVCPDNNNTSSSCTPVEILPDGQGLKYLSRVEIPEEGTEACLEVKVKRDGSVITTKRTGSSDTTSNQISVQLVDGGSRVNIQQSQILQPVSESQPPRPASLLIPGTKYSTLRPQSLYQGRGASPLSTPRYNSLPNLKGMVYESGGGGGGWGYQSHPRDEEKRLAYTRALLSHQMEQLFKLESSLREEREGRDSLRDEVRTIEEKWKRKSLKSQSFLTGIHVGQLEADITNLRGECGAMSERVTNLTGGKVPLGETSINFADYLKGLSSVPETSQNACSPANTTASTSSPPLPNLSGEVGEGARWACSECTFSNHPSLDTCEICEMPRINLGTNQTNKHSHPSPAGDSCFCHTHSSTAPPPTVRPPPNYVGKVFSSAKVMKPGMQDNKRLTSNRTPDKGKNKKKSQEVNY